MVVVVVVVVCYRPSMYSTSRHEHDQPGGQAGSWVGEHRVKRGGCRVKREGQGWEGVRW